MPSTRYGMPADDSAVSLEPLDAVELSKSSIRAFVDDRDYPTGEQASRPSARLLPPMCRTRAETDRSL